VKQCADAAIYFDPYSTEDISEKIHQVVNNEQLRSDLRIKGTARAKQFNWDETARQTCAVIEEILQ